VQKVQEAVVERVSPEFHPEQELKVSAPEPARAAEDIREDLTLH
jgi:hypothetical protein